MTETLFNTFVETFSFVSKKTKERLLLFQWFVRKCSAKNDYNAIYNTSIEAN